MTHSFPTRRSSDLPGHLLAGLAESARNFAFLAFMYGIIRSAGDDERQRAVKLVYFTVAGVIGLQIVVAGVLPRFEGEARSEEHTSELQSLMRISYAVFCLKKKNRESMDSS